MTVDAALAAAGSDRRRQSQVTASSRADSGSACSSRSRSAATRTCCSSTSRRSASTSSRGADSGSRCAASRRAGRTIVLTTHYLEEADALADRVVMLSAGTIVADGAPHEIKARVASRRIRCVTALPAAAIEALAGVVSVRRDGAATEIMTSDAERVVRQLLLARCRLSGLEMSGAGLEEAFLTLTSAPPAGSRTDRSADGRRRRCAMNATTGQTARGRRRVPTRSKRSTSSSSCFACPGTPSRRSRSRRCSTCSSACIFGRGTVGGVIDAPPTSSPPTARSASSARRSSGSASASRSSAGRAG